MRPMGGILLDLEKLMEEMVYDHDLQWGDVISLVHGYLMVHMPTAQEEYVEGGHPVLYYGPSGHRIDVQAKPKKTSNKKPQKIKAHNVVENSHDKTQKPF